mmetsp:Transcript_16916/g.27694  ORF Transcript_16916/g.27694 Transcript_16916/m.27694 type:complete len:151 (+) Transcript_16916:145-597(+)
MHQIIFHQSAQVINNMISVERIEGFRDLPSEVAFTTDDDEQISPDWPQNGSIDVQDLSVRYRDGLPLSLRNLSFKIDGGSRVGKLIVMSSLLVFFAFQRLHHLHLIPQLISLLLNIKESLVELVAARARCYNLCCVSWRLRVVELSWMVL